MPGRPAAVYVEDVSGVTSDWFRRCAEWEAVILGGIREHLTAGTTEAAAHFTLGGRHVS